MWNHFVQGYVNCDTDFIGQLESPLGQLLGSYAGAGIGSRSPEGLIRKLLGTAHFPPKSHIFGRNDSGSPWTEKEWSLG